MCGRFRIRLIVALASATTVVAVAASPDHAPEPPGTTASNTVAPREIIGLFVGIGDYEDPSVWSFDLHRTNEAVLLPLLSDRFGVRWLPSVLDAAATRDGIRTGMMGLLAETRAAAARGSDVTVLFVYTGHGSQLRDQDGDEPDGKDESLVTHRSSIEEGAYDIRDDDIAAFRRAVADTGAELVMIVEACHSESTFRGPPPMAPTRPRRPRGPVEPLFGELAEFYSVPGGEPLSQLYDGGDSTRFVSLAAAQDDRTAATTYVDDRQWGCFSLALVAAIETLPPGATYRELHEAVVREFDVRFPSERQRPTLHPRRGRTAHVDVPVFGGRFRSPHARLTVDAETRVATLDAGDARGYSTDARVAIFASLDALEAWERDDAAPGPLWEARIAHSTFHRASVHEAPPLPRTAVVRVVVPALPPAAVHLGDGVDTDLADAVRIATNPAIVDFTESLSEASFVLEAAGEEDGRAFVLLPSGGATRWSEAASERDGGDGAHARERPVTALRTIAVPATRGATATLIAKHLEFVVRTQRFWALQGDARDIEVRVAPADAAEGASLASRDGTLVCEHDTRVSIIITNRAREARRIGLFQSEAPDGVLGAIELVYAPRDGLAPGASVTITGPLRLSAGGHDRELLRLKVVSATLDQIRLPAELVAPETAGRHRAAAAEPDPFAAMFGQAQSATRSATATMGWAARNLMIEIRRSTPG